MSAIGTGNIRARVLTISLGTFGILFSIFRFVSATVPTAGCPPSCTMNGAVITAPMRELPRLGRPNNEERVDCQSDLECERVLWFCIV